MREVGAGDSQSQLDWLNEIIGDLSEFDKKIFSDNFFSSVKNWMLDWCNTQKKIKTLLIDFEALFYPD